MGQSKFGQVIGDGYNGGRFYAPAGIQYLESAPAAGTAAVAVVTAQSATCLVNADALVQRVRTAITAPVTGSSGAGSMDRDVKTTLSGAMDTAVLAGL